MAKGKKALITGITGQDGSYLAELLLKKGYEVSGIVRKTSHEDYANIGHIQDELKLFQGDLLDPVSLREIIQKVNPDEVYNLASQSHPSESFKQPIHTAEITGIGAHRVLDATLDVNPKTKFYQASSLFVLNSSYEGLSHVILEAMYYKLPIIASAVGGNPELIKDDYNGCLVEYNNKGQIKEAILRLWNNLDLQKKFVDNSREKLKNFSREKMVEKTIKALNI